jgi:hypothetical protein
LKLVPLVLSEKSKFAKILNKTWQKNIETISTYKFPDGKNSFGGKTLNEFSLATGGTPIRSVVVSTWRSGSTFFGDLLSQLPANFYFYEPMISFGMKNIPEPEKIKAVEYVKNLFNCDFNRTEKFLKYGNSNELYYNHSSQFHSSCKSKEKCFDPDFLEPFCKLFPVQTMKLIQLRMNLAAELLKDER